jgi:hypothetical protein
MSNISREFLVCSNVPNFNLSSLFKEMNESESILSIPNSCTRIQLSEFPEKSNPLSLLEIVRELHKTTRFRQKISRDSQLFVVFVMDESVHDETERIKRLLALKIIMSKHLNLKFIFIGLTDDLVSFGQEICCDYNFRYDEEDTPKVLFELTKPQDEIDLLVESFAKNVITDAIQQTSETLKSQYQVEREDHSSHRE